MSPVVFHFDGAGLIVELCSYRKWVASLMAYFRDTDCSCNRLTGDVAWPADTAFDTAIGKNMVHRSHGSQTNHVCRTSRWIIPAS